MQLSPDPNVAERQIEAVIFYLTALGYIDSEFDLTEKAFVRKFLRGIVTERVDARGPLAPEVRFEEIERQHEHYVEVFREIDREVRELFDEAVADGEDPKDFVIGKLKLRCFEMLSELDEDARAALMEVVDGFIHADGVVHPAEIEFRNELAGLLDQEILIEDVELVGDRVEITEPAQLAPTTENHPFFRTTEHHYSRDPALIRKQIEADLAVLDKAEAQWDAMRARGEGRLVGKETVDDLEGEAPFLDGHVHVVPPSDEDADLTVLGDLHGCYSNLKAAVLQSGFMDKVRAYKAAPETTPFPALVLLGDYIDRGRFSYNGVLRAVLQLFLAAPEHVFVLRGNHEYYIEYEGRVYGGVRPAEAINSLSSLVPEDVFRRYLRFFERMPNSLLFGRGLFVHAGIPRDATLAERWKDLSSLNDPDIRFQMLWSDPSRADRIPDDLQAASARFSFGRLQFRNFMGRIGCSLLVRGHEKVNRGFADHYPKDDARLLTVFSAGGVANEDLPRDSSYRDVRPMALSILRTEGVTTVTPWPIDYRRYQDPRLNAFREREPEVDIVPET
ncbi:MAG: serine/threonine protein phosphatase [Deltaproteobacteria bacterium]|nr:MAG: serine/threonine protein phosphatase [Deltaproteobacteria bacterium]